MCGIALYNTKTSQLKDGFIEFLEGQPILDGVFPLQNTLFKQIVPLISSRGPNYASLRSSKIHSTAWFSSVLSLRDPFTKQCVEVSDCFVLQYNGELYNDDVVHNDTQYFSSLLQEIAENKTPPEFEDAILNVISLLEGEFAYTISDLKNAKIYFGRDPVGKRSLSYLVDMDSNGDLYIASVTGRTEQIFTDCLAGAVYIFDVKTRTLTVNTKPTIRKEYHVSPSIDLSYSLLDSVVKELYEVLYIATKRRVETIHPAHIENSPISVLFSGGLDCSVIVALICECLRESFQGKDKVTDSPTFVPTLELLNVAFENPRAKMMPKDASDRLLAQSSANTLRALYPEIDIRLVEIDVSYREYCDCREKVIDLMYPKNTEMDLSIAIAFYFASRGKGFTFVRAPDGNSGCRVPYKRKGIVLFSGLGADELYGGYHKFANKDTKALVEELTKQINNIHDRNLNRDDKVIADNGVEVRYPYLDCNVIEYSTMHIPINYKRDKFILRELATRRLALGSIAGEPKRAIQFGSKSAKMTKDGNKNGTDILKNVVKQAV